MSTGGCRGSGAHCSRSQTSGSPTETWTGGASPVVPRLSLPEGGVVPQTSPRVPMSPRAHGGSPNSSRKDAQRGSPRFGTPRDSGHSPRDSARDSARLESARRRTADSVNAYVMRRRNCTSTGDRQRSSVGDGSSVKVRRSNPLLNGHPKATTPGKGSRRSPRVASPEEDGGTGGASYSGSGVRVSVASPHSTPARGSGVHAKNRRSSSASPALLNEVVWAMASNLESNSILQVDVEGHSGAGEPPCVIARPVIETPLAFALAAESPLAGPRSVAAHPITEGPVIYATALGSPLGDPRTIHVDPTGSAGPTTGRSESSDSIPPSPSSIGAPSREEAPSNKENFPTSGPIFSHKKTPSFRSLGEGIDNGALRSARTVSSPIPDEDLMQAVSNSLMQRLEDCRNIDVDAQEDNESYVGSTCGRVEALCDKAQNLVLQMSAYVTPPVPPPSCAVRAAVAGLPGKPPRPPLPAMPQMPTSSVPVASPAESGFSSVGQNRSQEEDELERLKFRVSHLELALKRRGGESQNSCSDEVVILRKQLEDAQGHLLGELQQVKGQIQSISQRLNTGSFVPPFVPGGSALMAVGGSFVPDTARSNSAPVQVLTPRQPTMLAVNTPTVCTGRDSPAAPGNCLHRPPSPQCVTRGMVAGMPASPLPTARVHRRPSSPHQNQAQAQLSVAPSNASFTPQQVVLGSACGSSRASPLRAQGHVQSAPCIAGTPPATARMASSQVHFGQVLNQDLIKNAAQKLQVHSAACPAIPVRVGGVPTHVVRSPRVAG